MTEMNDLPEKIGIHWIGFCICLVASPIVLSATLLVPLAALNFAFDQDEIRGLMSFVILFFATASFFYFLIGTPVLIWHLRRHAPTMDRIVKLSILSDLAIIPLGALAALITSDEAAIPFALLISLFGLAIAPPLAATFVYFYNWFTPA